jgi:phosphate-selective porin OprO/OprP
LPTREQLYTGIYYIWLNIYFRHQGDLKTGGKIMTLRKSFLRLLACTALSGIAVATPAWSKKPVDPRDRRIEALEKQVADLVQVVNELRQDRTKQDATAATATAAADAKAEAAQAQAKAAMAAASALPPTPNWVSTPVGATIVAGKPIIQSADGRFSAGLHAVMQFDSALYLQHKAGPITSDFRRGGSATDIGHARDLNNGTNFRRARFGVDGKLFGDFDYNVLFEFGGSGAEDAAHIQELWLQYTGLKPFKFRVGAFPPSIGLEDQASTNGSLFVERPAIADIARSVAGGDYREAFQLSASGPRWLASAAITARTVGTINSTGSSTAQSFDQALGGIARLVWLPVMGDDYLVHLGVHGSRVFKMSDVGGPDSANRYPAQLRERPELRVDGTRLIDTGAINADHVNTAGFELAAQKQQFLIQGEYERISIQRHASALSDPHFHGWYVEGGWVLTGERRKYNSSNFAFDAPSVDHPLDLKAGTYGAFELAARYSLTDLNYNEGLSGAAQPVNGVRGGEQKIASAGINWYPNSATKFMFEYQHVDIDRLSPNAVTFSTPVGAQIGQKYSTVVGRAQFAF